MRIAGRTIVLAAAALLGAAAFSLAPTAGPALAQEVFIRGDPAEREARSKRLFAALATARSETAARRVAGQIWRFWFEAPDEEAARLMREALERRRLSDFAATLTLLDELVARAPDWAEAWNQRATVRFLTDDYDGSLADIDRVLPLEPRHFGALSGQALILMRQGRAAEAEAALRRAVKINPFLRERALLPPEPQGRDI